MDFTTRHTSMKMLFETFDDEDMDISEVMTPNVKLASSKLFLIDEDSGLGMEYDDRHDHNKTATSSTPTSQKDETPVSYCVRRTLFQKKRRHDVIDQEDSHDVMEQEDSQLPNYREMPRKRKGLPKSLSYGDEPRTMVDDVEVRAVVDRFAKEDDLIGNGSSLCCLPTTSGKHSDLKSITVNTMVDVLSGSYNETIESFRIIDCRYPYEFEGGHIQGAENIYLKEDVENILKDNVTPPGDGKRHILVFHCEFSSERGPKMLRFLRNADRQLNKDRYPHLNFPEIYLLHDGYKAFYENKKEFCTPMAYVPMLHNNHSEDLRHFRSKSKSWSLGDKRKRTSQRLRF